MKFPALTLAWVALCAAPWAQANTPLPGASSASAPAPSAPTPQRLKAPEAPTGSRIRGDAAQATALPLDKRYGQFTAAERAALKSLYEPMPEADEPPFPRDGLAPFILTLREAATRRQASGLLVLVAKVAPDGSVDGVDIYASPDEAFTRVAAIALGRTAFKPARCGGKPCRMEFPFSTVIQLE